MPGHVPSSASVPVYLLARLLVCFFLIFSSIPPPLLDSSLSRRLLAMADALSGTVSIG
jgi:hypothetical protein